MPVLARPLVDELRAALDPPVELRETHTAWVLLTPTMAYKLKKPVHFGFVDLSTVEARRRVCEEEARVNRALAPGIVIGVRAIVRDGEGGLHLEVPVEAVLPHALDWVVAMHRYDEADTLAARIAARTLGPHDIDLVAARIAQFHAEADVIAPRRAAGRAFGTLVRRNLRELRPLVEPLPDGPRLLRGAAGLQRLAGLHAPELDARGAGGLVRDGHGDLRAEHVVLTGGHVTVVDRLEFDASLRAVDVADDLGFLAMDLEALGAGWAATRLVSAYRRAGGDPDGELLVALFGAYRAHVRAKVELLRAAQVDEPAPHEALAVRLLGLAERLMWRARGRMVVLVTGPPASGKSTVAAALADRTGFPVHSSDTLRKRALALRPDEPAPLSAYTTDGRARIYAQLAERVMAARGRSAIVDATFGDPAARAAFIAGLGPAARRRLWVVECQAPADVRIARARSRGNAHGSDAGPQLAARLAAAFVPFEEVPAPRRVAVDTDADPADVVDAIAAAIDARGRAGNYAPSRRPSPDGERFRRP